MGILDMFILCSLYPSWHFALVKLLSLHLIHGFLSIIGVPIHGYNFPKGKTIGFFVMSDVNTENQL